MLGGTLPRGASRRLIVLYALLLFLPATVILWLGVQLVLQEHQLEATRLRDLRDRTADQVVRGLKERLAASERLLDTPTPPGEGGVRIVLRSIGVQTYPAGGLLYHPAPSLVAQDDDLPEFAAGEELERGSHNLDGAAEAYRKLAASRDSRVRAGALLRLARVLRKQEKVPEARAVYEALSGVTDARLYGVPAELVARRAMLVLLEETGRSTLLQTEAMALRAELRMGTWAIDRGTYEQYDERELGRWLGTVENPSEGLSGDTRALTEAVEWLWAQRGGSGRRALRFADTDLTMLWRSNGDDTFALVAFPAFRDRQWYAGLVGSRRDDGLQVELASNNEPESGVDVERDSAIVRRAASTGLPWTVTVGGGAADPEDVRRRSLIVLGLGLLVVLVGVGGYVVARAVSRELAVARMQAEFVASVSHEFRTPLTSLRQFTDLLNEADDLSPDKRRRFYAAQARATERLQRLVESLLDFRRMEAGTYPYVKRQVPALSLVQGVVDDFRAEVSARGFEVEYDQTGHGRVIEADPEAVSVALWNVLDNAVKYSGDSRRIWVSVLQQNGSIVVRVRDRGLGVPAEEQRQIFDSFVRGRDARIRAIKGTGIGLAMVQHIVRGHGGRVTVESAADGGSIFTILLPLADVTGGGLMHSPSGLDERSTGDGYSAVSRSVAP